MASGDSPTDGRDHEKSNNSVSSFNMPVGYDLGRQYGGPCPYLARLKGRCCEDWVAVVMAESFFSRSSDGRECNSKRREYRVP
jgi:hypothetical protein